MQTKHLLVTVQFDFELEAVNDIPLSHTADLGTTECRHHGSTRSHRQTEGHSVEF